MKRIPRVMPMCQFALVIVPAAYVGFSRLSHMRFVGREPMLTGILRVVKLPPQSTYWRAPELRWIPLFPDECPERW
jgi:hypothetical protein